MSRLTPRMRALLDDAAREAGVQAVVTQGSYSGSVGASAGTHDGGGAADLSTRGQTRAQSLALVNALRKRNGCAWWRTAEFGWSGTAHIHVIVRDEPGLSPAAQRQVADYDRGLNGLASHGRDPFPRPPQSPFNPAPTPTPTPEDDDMGFCATDPRNQNWHFSGVWRTPITWDQSNLLGGLAQPVPYLGHISDELLDAYLVADAPQFCATDPDNQNWHCAGVWRVPITWDTSNALGAMARPVPYMGKLSHEALAGFAVVGA